MYDVGTLSGSTQMERRRAEHAVKRRAIAFSRLVSRCNANGAPFSCRHDVTDYLSMGRQCLDHWRREWRQRERIPRRRGRPETRSGPDVCERALEFLEHVGPSVSVASLRSRFPELGRNEASRMVTEFRNACRTGLRAEVYALHWKRPGSVWAMDHMEPPSPVDGEYAYIMVVRDLASHFLVSALPQRSPNDRAVAYALEELFVQYGAPLVIKSDNGGGLTGPETRDVLRRWGVQHLVSPPYLPRYNGSVEAGIGQLKPRIHVIATQHDRPGEWGSNHVEGARLLVNRTLRPWGRNGPTPEERWNRRILIGERERERLYQMNEDLIAQYEAAFPEDFFERREHHSYIKIASNSTRMPPWAKRWNGQMNKEPEEDATKAGTTQNDAGQHHKRRLYYRKIRRRSLTDAMVAMGLLVIRKRVIPLPIKRIMRLKI